MELMEYNFSSQILLNMTELVTLFAIFDHKINITIASITASAGNMKLC